MPAIIYVPWPDICVRDSAAPVMRVARSDERPLREWPIGDLHVHPIQGVSARTSLRRDARAAVEQRPLFAPASVLEMTISGLSLGGIHYLKRAAEVVDAIDRGGIGKPGGAAENRRLLRRRC